MKFLDLMYITNRIDVAALADECGVDMIFIDLEVKGKEERQANMDTVKSKHSPDDILRIKPVLKNAKILCRVNSINDDSKSEIDKCIKNGADIIMLPYYKNCEEVRRFISYVGGRAKVCLLLETAEAAECVDETLKIPGIDMIHIGLNDLHLSYHKDFMFELLIDGTVERLARKIKAAGITFGFGGIARIGMGMLPAEHVIAEHFRLGSHMAILSRSFCNASNCENIDEVKDVFKQGLKEIYNYQRSLYLQDDAFFAENRVQMTEKIENIVKNIKKER